MRSFGAALTEYPRPSMIGPDVINLATGDPGLPTPPQIVEHAGEVLASTKLTYTNVHGTKELRAAIASKLARDNDLEYPLDQITVSSGSKQVIINALFASLDPGDEVIVPAPYFAPYPRMVVLAGGEPVFVRTSPAEGFKLDADALSQAITERTRWILLNNPSNPAGAVYTLDELTSLAVAAFDESPTVGFISDEVYENYLYEGAATASMATVSAEASKRTLTVNSVSKSYSMTGWRIGYGAGPAELIAAMGVVQHATTTSPGALGQAASITALGLRAELLSERREQASHLRDTALNGLDEIAGLATHRPSGAMYVFVGGAGLLGAATPEGKVIDSDVALGRYLHDMGRVLVMPGPSFGDSPYFRLTFVVDPEVLAEGLRRIAESVAALRVGP